MLERIKQNIPIICVIILIILSIILKFPDDTKNYKNSDATYHTLLTMKCYDETPISVHKFLPIVSLGDEEDKNITWGGCVKDNSGNYYYTSFSAATFVLPYFFVKIFHLPINIYSLYIFNSIICIISYILITYIFIKLFSKYISKNVIILFTGLIYLFQIETMHSLGVVYWAQSIFQVLIAIQFILFMNYKNKKAKIAFFAMCLIMPYVEWTGYVSNVGYAFIIFVKKIIEDRKITLKAFIEPIIIGIMTILAFGIFSGHFLLNLKFNEYISALKDRFLARNLTNSSVSIKTLFKDYMKTYKYIIFLCLVMFTAILSIKEYRKKLWELIKEYKYETILFVFILLENIIMLEHAIIYTFDRLKFTYILILSFYIMLSTIVLCNKQDKKFLINLIGIFLISIAIINAKNYKKGDFYLIANHHEKSNKVISQYVNENYNTSNSIICSSGNIRGYMNLLFDRGIHERVTYTQAQWITNEHKKEYLIYINARNEMEIDKVYIKNVHSNKEKTIYVKNNELLEEEYIVK